MEVENDIHEETKILDTDNTIRFCDSCGKEIFEGQKFCPGCGKKVNEKELKVKKILKNKKYISFAVGIILFTVGVISITSYIKNQQRMEQRNDYLLKIKDFHEQIIIAGANLEDISNTIKKYWNENIFDDKHGDDINEAILAAMEYKNSEIDKAKAYDEELLELYRNLKTIPEDSEDLNYILPSIDELYNSYTDFYSFAINPKGNYTQYISDNNDKIDDFSLKYRSLNNIIKTSSEFENIKSINEKLRDIMKQYNLVSGELDYVDKDNDEDLIESMSNFTNKENIDISEIKKESKKLKENDKVSDAIDIVLSTYEYYEDMIHYSKKYEKSKSQSDLNEFKSSMLSFRSNISIYILHYDSLE